MDAQQQAAGPWADPRLRGLGALAALPDDVICLLLHALDLRELLALSQCSKLLRVFACEEPEWLARHLERCARPFDYRVRAGSAMALGSAPLPALLPPLPPPTCTSPCLLPRAPGEPPSSRTTPPASGQI